MARYGSVYLSRKLIISLAASFLWMALGTGIFSLVTGSYVMLGLLWIGLGFALVVALIQGSLLARLERRPIPIPSVVIIVLILVLVGVSELIDLLMTTPTLSLSYIFDAIYAVGLLILAGYAASLLAKAPRSGAPDPRISPRN